MDLLDALRRAPEKSGLVQWLAESDRESAQETRDFLETCLGRIPKQKQGEVLAALGGPDPKNQDSKVYELVAHEFYWRVEASPVFQPKRPSGKTPDLNG